MQSAPFLTIGTRGSLLALMQAHLVRRLLSEAHHVAEDEIAVKVISTSGDRITDRPLSEAGGKGLFSKEIEAALAAGEVDLGVHSTKDMASQLPDGLGLVAFLEREDVRDAFISNRYGSLADLPPGAKFGTSSIRRAAQLRRARPDLEIVPFRGNVDTRLGKLEAGIADATLLAAAGLHRLKKQDRINSYLDPHAFPPAPAQGAIGIEIRLGDARTANLVKVLNHDATERAVAAERGLLATLDGSCRTPIGAYTEMADGRLSITAEILSPEGSDFLRLSDDGPVAQASEIGRRLGQNLLDAAGPEFRQKFGA